MPLSSLPLDPHEPGGAIQPNLPQRTPGCEKCGLERDEDTQKSIGQPMSVEKARDAPTVRTLTVVV